MAIRDPLKFNAQTAAVILRHVQAGNFQETAARAAGIDPSTLWRWLKLAEKQADGHPLKTFARDLRKAEAKAETSDLAAIRKAGKTDYRALTWRLERMYPARYGQRVRVEVDRELEAALDKLQNRLDADTYAKVLSIISDGGEVPSGTDEDGEPSR